MICPAIVNTGWMFKIVFVISLTKLLLIKLFKIKNIIYIYIYILFKGLELFLKTASHQDYKVWLKTMFWNIIII